MQDVDRICAEARCFATWMGRILAGFRRYRACGITLVMTAVLQSRLPFLPWMDPRTARLPGVQPLDPEDWLRVDEAFAGQMAERDRLIGSAPDKVHALLPQARAAAEELYDLILARLAETSGYRIGAQGVIRPDGVSVPLDRTAPLLTLGQLVQEDLCLMQADGQGEHALTGAILCFPASWTLAEKLGHPMVRIHRPVADYTDDIAPRVQRLFDAIRPERPLWRMNYGLAQDADLFRPRSEAALHETRTALCPYVRCERQCLLRLPQTGAVVFSIHTYLVRADSLDAEDHAKLLEAIAARHQ